MGTKLQASPCSLSASTWGSDYPAFSTALSENPGLTLGHSFPLVHKVGEILGDLSAALKAVPQKCVAYYPLTLPEFRREPLKPLI